MPGQILNCGCNSFEEIGILGGRINFTHNENAKKWSVGSLEQDPILNKTLETANTTLNITTFNVRTLKAEEKLDSFEKQLSEIKWEVVGLAEVEITREGFVEKRTGNILYQIGKKKRSQTSMRNWHT